MLDALQRDAFGYFLHETNPANGLVEGINWGAVVLACENHRSGLLWRLTRRCSYVITGLRRAGFANGWL